ncbi:MAG: hypothetical protein IIB38_02355, partial [Candidatus Hydrogenedentes bacterium]|nr:hypothetical protein [Candidatus Hydrogenedentota bacterium]
MDKSKFGRREWFKKAAVTGAGMGAVGSLLGNREVDAKVGNFLIAQAEATAKVPTRELGATGEQIPILLMGCSQKFDMVYDKMLHRAFKDGMYYM